MFCHFRLAIFVSHEIRQDISIECPDIAEVMDAVNHKKTNKAPGADSMLPEMLKADSYTTVNILLCLGQNFWLPHELDPNFKEGYIVNIPKKGDLTNCKNGRGITITANH